MEKEPFTPRGRKLAEARRSSGAFTLVELLVVVGVISLLAAILFLARKISR